MAYRNLFAKLFIISFFVVSLQANSKPACCMQLKYQSEIDKLSPCFIGYDEIDNRIAFRWVFENINDTRNFLPQPKTESDPKRKFKDFKFWSLSFFDSLAQSKAELDVLIKGRPEIYRKLGTHAARGIINKPDGLSEIKSDEKGHFNHFEYVDVDFAPRFSIVAKIAG